MAESSPFLKGPTTPLCTECSYYHAPDIKHACYSCGEDIDDPKEENSAGGRMFCDDVAARHRADGQELDEYGRWVP